MDTGQNEQLRVHCDSFDFDTIDSFLVIESFLAIVSLDSCVMIMDIGGILHGLPLPHLSNGEVPEDVGYMGSGK